MVAKANQEPIFYLPDLAEGLEEAELIEWSVRVGQRVSENDILAKMETAKALVDIPSPRAGVIAMLHGKPGQAIKVGAPLVTFTSDSPTTDGDGRQKKPMAPPSEEADAGSVVGNLGEAPVRIVTLPVGSILTVADSHPPAGIACDGPSAHIST